MRIAVIGTGQVGGALTRRLAALGHEVAVANSRGPDTLAGLAAETGAAPAPIHDVARGAEVVVVAVPEGRVPDLPASLLDTAAPSAAVVDAGNYYRQRDGAIAPILEGMPESRWVAEQLGRPVVKAFNTIQAQHLHDLGRPAGAPGRIALPVAGDDPAAKDVVLRLVDELGFDPVDAGGLGESWRQQPGTPVYGADLDAAGVHDALARAHPSRGG